MDENPSCIINDTIYSSSWDINNDGNCSMLDLSLASYKYGQIGFPGWIREDIDNNGKVEVYDFVLLSNHYADSWLKKYFFSTTGR